MQGLHTRIPSSATRNGAENKPFWNIHSHVHTQQLAWQGASGVRGGLPVEYRQEKAWSLLSIDDLHSLLHVPRPVRFIESEVRRGEEHVSARVFALFPTGICKRNILSTSLAHMPIWYFETHIFARRTCLLHSQSCGFHTLSLVKVRWSRRDVSTIPFVSSTWWSNGKEKL